MWAAAAPTTSAAVSRKASNALIPNAQAVIHQTRPTVSATRTDTQPTRLRIFVTALKALFMARSAPEPSEGSMPTCRAKEAPS